MLATGRSTASGAILSPFGFAFSLETRAELNSFAHPVIWNASTNVQIPTTPQPMDPMKKSDDSAGVQISSSEIIERAVIATADATRPK
jgi:hypothetical protein